jgi:hypothetical protein
MLRFTLAALCLLTFTGAALAEDCSVWRWTASRALDAQQTSEPSSNDAQYEFVQRYERYSFNGQPEAAH